MVPLIYFGIAFVVFCVTAFAVARNTTDQHVNQNDLYLLHGLLVLLASVAWPIFIFTGVFWALSMHYQKKYLRNQELQRELSRG